MFSREQFIAWLDRQDTTWQGKSPSRCVMASFIKDHYGALIVLCGVTCFKLYARPGVAVATFPTGRSAFRSMPTARATA